MQFLKFKDYIRYWSTWVLGAVTVTPVLSDQFNVISNLVPEHLRPYVITGLGVVGLIARAIKQK